MENELVSLITEPIPLDDNNNILIRDDDEQDKHETGNSHVCRICYSTGDLQSLMNPCECSGTMGILHRNCLERWLEISNTTKCEICQHEFDVVRYPRSLFYFLTNPLRSSDTRYLINDIILFLFLTIILSWLSVLNVAKIRAAKTWYDGISFIILPLCVFFIYIVWCWVSFRYHLQVIKEWRSMNQLIRVLNKRPIKINFDPMLSNGQLSTGENEENNLFPDIRIIK